MTVHLNRDGPQSIAAPQAFETTGEFSVYLQNHGRPLHAHVSLDNSLSAVARVVTPNRYVEAGATRRVRIEVGDVTRPIDGRLKIVIGYGAETAYVSVTIKDSETVDPDVAVDESLSSPSSPPDPPQDTPDRLMLGGLLAIALLLAVVTVLLVENLLALAGVLAILVAVVTAGYFLTR